MFERHDTVTSAAQVMVSAASHAAPGATPPHWIRPLRRAYEVMSALALKLIFSRMRLR